MKIKRYDVEEEAALFAMLREEGEAWIDYHGAPGRGPLRQGLGVQRHLCGL